MTSIFRTLFFVGLSLSIAWADSSSVDLRHPSPINFSEEFPIAENIIREERWLARMFAYSSIIQENPFGRLMLDLIEDEVENPSIMDHLPIEKIAENQKFLKRANIRFDQDHKIWQARWKKPRVFHFGMLLRPALVDQVEAGQSFNFLSNGREMVLSKTNDNKLMFGPEGGAQGVAELGAKELKLLLERRVIVDDMELFLDRKGNLILEAKGKAAQVLSQFGS
ncbi:MAG: hypothetical protein AAGA18_07975 [Verrucomicrobiota bacterium]